MWMRAFVICAALCVFASSAKAAAVSDVAPCAEAKDLAICLLSAAGKVDGGRTLFEDSILAANPGLIAAAGYSRETVAAARLESERSVQEEPIGPSIMAEMEAERLDDAGLAPNLALVPVLALSTKPVPPPFFDFAGRTTSDRLMALAGVAMSNGSLQLRAEARREWENELVRRASPADPMNDLDGLIRVCRKAKDTGCIDRALHLGRSRDDAEQIQLLVTAGRFDQALALSRRAKLGPIEARIRAEGIPNEPAFDWPTIVGVADGSRNPKPDTPDGLRFLASRILTEARTGLVVMADMENEDAIAQQAADDLIPRADPRSLGPATLNNIMEIASTASPDRGAQWLRALERELPVRKEDGYYRPDQLQLIMKGIADGWRVMEREDQVDAFIARWRPAGLAEVQNYLANPSATIETPYADVLVDLLLWRDRVDEARPLMTDPSPLLEYELRERQGIANLDLYLREARTDRERLKVLSACLSEAVERDEMEWVFRCLTDISRLVTTTNERVGVTQIAVQSSAISAARGDLDSARAFLEMAFAAIDKMVMTDPVVNEQTISDLRLLAIARAELRADGRLPPLAPSAKR